ncbi:MAG: CRTAC1 family protein [Planctomycetota bacterium]|nr:CRTAC1 family protein [Planctomycetota bacterium]
MRRPLLLLVLVLALLPAAPARGEDETPWFTDVAAAAGLEGVSAKRTKLMDFTGDGWPDVLVMQPSDQPIGHLARTQQFFLYASRPGAKGEGRRFVDVTKASGLHCGRAYQLVIAGDVDNDGDLDLFASGYATQDPGQVVETAAFVLLNDGKGRFTPLDQAGPETAAAPDGPNQHPATVCGATFADVDRDGRLDLFLGAWYRYWGGDLQLFSAYPDRLYRGLGDGRFDDVTEERGLMLADGILHALPEADRKERRVRPETRALIGRGAHKPTYGTAAADWDNDGDIDLFTMSYGRQWNLHWRNDGKRFVEIGETTHFDGDEDESGTYPEQFHPKGRKAELPFRSNGNSFDATFADFDNDGDLDCVVSEYTHAWAGSSSDVTCILTNTGKEGGYAFERTQTLDRVHSRESWNQGDICTAFADLDNDGWQELLISSCVYPDHNVLEVFRRNRETGAFERVTEAIGLTWPDSTQISLSDYDRDGDLDVLAGNMPYPSRKDTIPHRVALFRNDVADRSGNHFLSLRLEGGPGTNRMAVGTRVLVTAGGITQLREITAGRGHVGHQDDTRLVFGLGKATVVDRIEIRWSGRKGTVDVHEGLPVDRFLLAREGSKPVPEAIAR